MDRCLLEMLSSVLEVPQAESDQLQICRCIERAANTRCSLGRLARHSKDAQGWIVQACDELMVARDVELGCTSGSGQHICWHPPRKLSTCNLLSMHLTPDVAFKTR